MIGSLTEACVALHISIGHQVGLFETMSKLPPSRSEEIASAARLNERYVREWLAALVAGGEIDCDPFGKTNSLTPEHAYFLTTAGGADNLRAPCRSSRCWPRSSSR